MDLVSKRNIRNLLRKYQIRPSKGLGQHFLIDRGVVKKVIGTAKLNSNDIVFEIGPGLGSLTQELAKKVKKVIAVEKDQKMIEILKETLKDFNNVKIYQGDILKWEAQSMKPEVRSMKKGSKRALELQTSYFRFPPSYKVVANLPFYLTAPVIRKFLELIEVEPRTMVLVVQKEVGQRICARPPQMSILAVAVQFYAKPEIISYVSKKSFWPQPKVDSAIIRITPKLQKISDRGTFAQTQNRDLFFKIVKAGFSQPRKQIVNNLSKMLKSEKETIVFWLRKNNLQPDQRAETLSIQEWIALTKSYLFYAKKI